MEKVLLAIGIVHWLFGGVICWAWEGIKLQQGNQLSALAGETTHEAVEPQEDMLTELIAHQNRRTSPRHTRLREELMTIYFLRHREHHS